MGFEGQKVIVHNSRSRTFFYGPEFPSFFYCEIDYNGDINIKEKSAHYEFTDLHYQPWIDLLDGDIIVGVGPFWKRVHTDIYLQKPIYLDDKGNLWAYYQYRDAANYFHGCIIRIKPENWRECENSNYEIFLDRKAWSDMWTAWYPASLFVVSGNQLLWFEDQWDYAFDIWERGFDVINIEDKSWMWGLGPLSREVPRNRFYFWWNVKGNYIVVGGTDWIYHLWWHWQGWEAMCICTPHGQSCIHEATGGMWGLPPPHYRRGVTLDKLGRLWFYYNGWQTAEIRDTSLNLIETRQVNWDRKPVVTKDLNYVVGNKIYKGTYYTHEEAISVPEGVQWSKFKPLGDSTSKWFVSSSGNFNGCLCDTNKGEVLYQRRIKMQCGDQMSSDEGLSWYTVFGGPPPKTDVIFNYVMRPDEINNAFNC